MSASSFDERCLHFFTVIELQKSFFRIPTAVIKEMRRVASDGISNKENKPSCWLSESLYNMQTCVVSFDMLQTDKKILNVEIPQLIHRLCSFLELHLNLVGLFRVSGSHKRVAVLKEHLKNGVALHNENPHDVANVLSQLLRQLRVHLIPKSMNFFIEQIVRMDKEKRILAAQLCCLLLPSSHLNSLIYICHFLNKVAFHSATNKMPSSSLAAVFAPNLLESSSHELEETRSLIIKQQEFLHFLIDNYQIIGIVPSCLRGSVCLAAGCSHKDPWKHSSLTSKETYKEVTDRVQSSRKKSLAGRLMSSVRKKKQFSAITKGDRCSKKRGLNDSSKEELSANERPAKRRSLQETKDVIINPTSVKVSPSASKAPQNAISSRKQERHGSGSATCFGSSSKSTQLQSFKQFHIGSSHSAADKPTTSKCKKNLARSLFYPAEDSAKMKRSSFLKKISGSIRSPALRRRSIRKKRAKLSETDNKSLCAKPSKESFAPNKRLTEISKSEGIRINDSITIFELSNTSIAESSSFPVIPSPILPSSNITREYDSFDCVEGRVAPPLDTSCSLPIGAPLPIASSSFDVLHRADSVALLESSQKQEEYFETMLDSQLDATNASHTVHETTHNDFSFQKAVDEKPFLISAKLPSPKLLPSTSYKLSTEMDDAIAQQEQLTSFPDDQIRKVCKSVLDDLVSRASNSLSACSNQDSKNLLVLKSKREERVKPVPPIRNSSLKTLSFPTEALNIVEDMNYEILEEKCVQPNYGEVYKGRCYNSVYRGFPAKPFDNSGQCLMGSVAGMEVSGTKQSSTSFYSSKAPGLKLSGKVSATVKHFNNLNASNHYSVQKLAPLPYREVRGRKGSFKMGRPSGKQLKIDIPSQLKLASSPSSVSDSPEILPVSKPSFPHNMIRHRHRKSKSLDSLADELQEFHHGSIPRSPSFPFIAAQHPTPIRVQHRGKPFIQNFDFLDSSPAKRLTPKQPRSRSPIMSLTNTTFV